MTEETARLVAAMREVLRDRQDVHLALLFGSQARGKARPDSDVDVAVQGENLDVLALYRDLSLAVHREVDVVDLARAGFPLLNAIARDHVIIHQGRPGAAGRWLSRAITQLETDRPAYERMRDAYLRKLAHGG
jgi:predicted nucleotidyltransferase